MKISTKVIRILWVLIFFIPSCLLLEEEDKKTIRHENYAIEPDSLLNALKSGEEDVFTIITNEIDWDTPTGKAVNWKQSDYFYIIESLFDKIFDDNLESWKLNSMSFHLSCDEIGIGFQEGRFEFFKVIKEDQNKWDTRISRNVIVDARYKFISVVEREHYPKILNWSIINLNELRINGADALQIAEMDGGAEKRIFSQNTCFINISLVPDAASLEGWHVSYSLVGEPNSIFSIEINPLTGEIIRSN